MTDHGIERLPEVLFEIGKAIGSDIDLDSLFARISELVCALIAADSCSILLREPGGNGLVARAAHGLSPGTLSRVIFRDGEGVAGWVVSSGQPALIPDVSMDPRYIALPEVNEHIVSMLCVPLLARGTCAGAMAASSTRAGAFSQRDLELLAFVARTIALDVENIRLRRLAITDPLTNAYNREFLHSQLPIEIDNAIARQQPLCVAMLDVDHFKGINDALGHDVGDRVLIELAARLRGTIRASDFLIRYGGEEFIVVLPNTRRERAWEVGERMRALMENTPVTVEHSQVPVRISVGIAQHRMAAGASEGTEELIRRADRALYAAKRRGRNRVEMAP
ncbi:GGDEF domain-containing protein [Haliangium sp.]|uniref:GGDEF domain-containing protein n=1 Tax=Haliangium sp. TaxID=2663208 RepID=UPI003D0E2075